MYQLVVVILLGPQPNRTTRPIGNYSRAGGRLHQLLRL